MKASMKALCVVQLNVGQNLLQLLPSENTFSAIQHFLFLSKIFGKRCFLEYQKFTQKRKVLTTAEKSSSPMYTREKTWFFSGF